jgi:histidyl-tRNA synthetase
VVSNSLVRGLDYYTNFVFEVKVEGISGSVGGGGRYSQLVSEMGGEDVNCIGFGLGVERVLGVLEQQNINLVEDFGVDVLVANIDESTKSIAFEIVDALRENNFSAICEYNTTKLPKHFTIAEKANAKYVLILGKKELEENKFTIKEQKTKKQYLIEKKELISFFRAEFSR